MGKKSGQTSFGHINPCHPPTIGSVPIGELAEGLGRCKTDETAWQP